MKKVDVAIIEVGLGGLLDSTNVAVPMLTGITTIGLDHTEILGDTIEEIAAQKAGIIKQGVPVVTGNIAPEAFTVIQQTAKAKNAPLYVYGENYKINYLHPDEMWGEVFEFFNEIGKIPQLTTPLLGQHQAENAGVAIELYFVYCQLEKLPFREKDVLKGLKKSRWPGRMERLSNEPLVVLDGAHNTHAMNRLVENLKKNSKDIKSTFCFPPYELKMLEKC